MNPVLIIPTHDRRTEHCSQLPHLSANLTYDTIATSQIQRSNLLNLVMNWNQIHFHNIFRNPSKKYFGVTEYEYKNCRHHCCNAILLCGSIVTAQVLSPPSLPRKKRVFREIYYFTIDIFHGILFFSVGKNLGDNTCLVTMLPQAGMENLRWRDIFFSYPSQSQIP